MERVFTADLSRGFLPVQDPIAQLPDQFEAWEKQAALLSKLLASGQVSRVIEALPEFPVNALGCMAHYERAMLILSYWGHACVWGDPSQTPDHLPEKIAKPWYVVSQKLGRPPVLSYASYALYNWQRLDPEGPIALGNLRLLQNFLGGVDEEWFILVHIEIEAHAKTGVLAIEPAIQSAHQKNTGALTHYLEVVANALENMCQTLDRMPEHCDPYIYYNRVRPYIHGWKDNPALPNGLVYEGVPEYENKGQKFKGETGAQSSIVPSFDALLGIEHADNPLKQHLQEMRQYMPPVHRQFLEKIERQSRVRDYVKKVFAQEPRLREFYNRCIQLVGRFRLTHLKYAAAYIQKQHQNSAGNPTEVGTGGTPFMEYLGKHKRETEEYLL